MPAEALDFIGRFLLILVAVLVYYGIILGSSGSLAPYIASHLSARHQYPYRVLNDAVRLVLSGLSQIVFCWVLILLTHVEPAQLGWRHFRPIMIVYGVFLGIGEMAFSTFLCLIMIRIVSTFFPQGGPTSVRDWLVLAKGGWIQRFLKTINIMPWPFALLSTVSYIAVEEVVFRGVLINYFLPGGALAALILATLLFTVVQTFRMPSWRAALFPVLGALVVGTVHSALFLAVPDILPLIVAHLVFFLTAVVG